MTDRDFTLPDNKGQLRYAVGQPMGAKSSFPMLGLTHHIIVMEAAARAGLTMFKDYVILGDDIMIANEDVAMKYKHIMECLGLGISEHKSIVSKGTDTFIPVAEICRRLFIGGMEISPLPVKLIATVFDNGDMAYQLQEEMHKRGQILNASTWKYFITNILKSLEHKKLIALLNCLPSWATGMKSQYQITTVAKYVTSQWKESRKFTLEQFEQMFIFTVLSEQLKRLGSILQNTENTYTTIMKAASVSKPIGLNRSADQYLPIEHFNEDVASDWEIVEVFHPAIDAVKAEVSRINSIILQMSVASESKMMRMLMDNIIDSLKISSFDMATDKIFGESKLTRQILDKTFSNIEKLQSEARTSDELAFSVKLGKLNVIWNLSVSLNRNVTLSRSTSTIRTTTKQMIAQFNDFESKL